MPAKPAGPTVTVQKIDESTVSGVLSGLVDGSIVLTASGGDVKVPLEDVVELTPGTSAAAAAAGHKLTGKVIGTAGSYNNQGQVKENAFDGNLETYFDAPKASISNAWVGLDLGSAKVITMVKFCPRTEFPDRMVGGRFQASNNADFSGETAELFLIAAEPPVSKLTTQQIKNAKAWRYVRYLGAANSSGNVAELEFWGNDPAPAALPSAPSAKSGAAPPVPAKAERPAANDPRKLKGTVIGTEGSWNDEGHVRDQAFDGDLNTYFDAAEGHDDDAWVGLDFGAPKTITRVRFAARSGQVLYRQRMVGGKFQGSSAADFGTDVTELAEITTRPASLRLTTMEVPGGKSFRYVRYLSPNGGHGNVAEIEFWGTDATPLSTAAVGKAATKPSSSQPGAVMLRAVFGEDDQLSGPLVAWSEKGLRLKAPFGDNAEIEIPVAALREVWRGTAEQVKQAKALPIDPGPEDAAFVVKDNGVVTVRGVVLGTEGDSLRFKFGDEMRKINLAKLVGVVLGGTESKRDRSFKQTVVLASGDTLSGQWKGYDKTAASLNLTTPWGGQVQIPFASVTKIRSANGRLVYLSDLKPEAVEQTPYLDRMLGYRIDKSLTGGALKLIDGDYPRGIAVHSRTVLTYDIGGDYEELKVKVGFQQPEGKLGQAAIRVIGDGKTLFDDPDARGDAPKPAELSLKVTGVHQLTLEVDFGKNQDTGDRVVWANARLLRAVKK